jgi:glycine dehydrogenase
MVEPTESESLAELDRFCEAMISIREEIDAIEQGRTRHDESPLHHAPHTTRAVTGEWDRSYSRATGAFPTGHTPDKYWPPVARIDQAYGDRHLVCSCPPPEAFEE